MVKFLQDLGFQATEENALYFVIALAIAVILEVALIACIFVVAARTRKLKKMNQKLDELIESNKQLLEAMQKKENSPCAFPMPQMPRMPHMGSSWRRR